MPDLILFLHVPNEVALQRGVARAGDHDLDLLGDQVKQIREEGLIDLVAPYVDTVKAARPLEQRLVVRGSQWCDVMDALRAKQIFRAATFELEARAHASGLAVLRALGRPDQLSRFEAGALPQDELVAVVRELAFAPFADLPRYHNKFLTPASLTHRFGCRRHEVNVDVKVGGKPKPALNAAEWERIHALRVIAETVPEAWARAVNEPGFAVPLIAAIEHRVTCPACLATHAITSFQVTVKWYGNDLTREYMP